MADRGRSAAWQERARSFGTPASSTPSWRPWSGWPSQRAGRDEIVAGFATRSYAATMTEQRRAEFLGEIRELPGTHPDTCGLDVLELPHVTTAYRLTLR